MRTGIIDSRIGDPDVVLSCDERYEAITHPRVEDLDVVVSCDERHEAKDENRHHSPKN